MAVVQHINVYKGSAPTLRFTMNPVEDITGWNIQLTVKKKATDPDADQILNIPASITDAAAGQFDVVLTHDDLDLPARVYVYDVQRVDGGSEDVLSIGQFTVLQEVLY